jgi:hypothetical protein
VISEPDPVINSFLIIPNGNDQSTVSKFKLDYELANPGDKPINAQLIATIYRDTQPLDKIVIYSGEVTANGIASGILEYVPSVDWANGNYSIHTDLYSQDKLCDSDANNKFSISLQKPVTVSWYLLVVIIGMFMLTAAITTVIILSRRQEFVIAWTENSHHTMK